MGVDDGCFRDVGDMETGEENAGRDVGILCHDDMRREAPDLREDGTAVGGERVGEEGSLDADIVAAGVGAYAGFSRIVEEACVAFDGSRGGAGQLAAVGGTDLGIGKGGTEIAEGVLVRRECILG